MVARASLCLTQAEVGLGAIAADMVHVWMYRAIARFLVLLKGQGLAAAQISANDFGIFVIPVLGAHTHVTECQLASAGMR